MAWAIITIYISKCAQMNPQQLSKTSKFYSRCKKCDIEKTLGGGYHPLGSPKVNYISAKVARNVGILTRAFRLLPKTARIKLYYAIVFPYLSYYNIVWASTYKTSRRKLIVIQKKGYSRHCGCQL